MPTAARHRADELLDRWNSIWPFGAVSFAAIIIGGLVAAVSGPTNFDKGPWLAAFLVLVTGIGQLGLGVGQAWLATDPPPPASVKRQLIAWNLGCVLTILGTLIAVMAVTALGAVLLIVALVLFGLGVRNSDEGPKWALHLFRFLVVLITVSAPIGLVIGWLKGH